MLSELKQEFLKKGSVPASNAKEINNGASCDLLFLKKYAKDKDHQFLKNSLI